jgi:hypothetical protein
MEKSQAKWTLPSIDASPPRLPRTGRVFVVPHGVSISLHENGAIEKIVYYDRGICHGDFKMSSPDGKTVAEMSYKQGLRHGLCIFIL